MTNTALTPLQRTVSADYLAAERASANYRVVSARDDITALLNVLNYRATHGCCAWIHVNRLRRAFAAAMVELDCIIPNLYLDGVFRAAVRRYRDAAGALYRATDDRRPTPEHIPAYDRCADTLCPCRLCAWGYYSQARAALNDLLYGRV